MKYIHVSILVFAMLFVGCLEEFGAENEEHSKGYIEFEVLEEETGERMTEMELFLFIQVADEEEEYPMGGYETDDEGSFSSEISGVREGTVEGVKLEYQNESGEIESVEKSISLELRFEEPFDSTGVTVEI